MTSPLVRLVLLAPLALAGVLVGSCAVTTRPTLELTPEGRDLAEGESVQLLAKRRYGGGDPENVTAIVDWSSSDVGTVRVSNKPGSKGFVEATGSVGRVVVRARDPMSGVVESLVFTARPPAIRAIVLPPAVELSSSEDNKRQLSATAVLSNHAESDVTSRVTWSSSSIGVVTVNDTGSTKGSLTAIRPGTAIISATDAETGVHGESVVFVRPVHDLLGLSITPNPYTVQMPLTVKFEARAWFSDGISEKFSSFVTWTSSRPEIATIDPTGVATPVAAGQTAISAQTPAGIRATALLVVQ